MAENQARFVRILSAVTLLTDPVKRAAFDRMHFRGPTAPGRPEASSTTSGWENSQSKHPHAEVFNNAERASWLDEYDRLVAWVYRREPLF